MIFVEETDAFTMGNSVQVTEINPNTATNIAERFCGSITREMITERLGIRKV